MRTIITTRRFAAMSPITIVALAIAWPVVVVLGIVAYALDPIAGIGSWDRGSDRLRFRCRALQ